MKDRGLFDAFISLHREQDSKIGIESGVEPTGDVDPTLFTALVRFFYRMWNSINSFYIWWL